MQQPCVCLNPAESERVVTEHSPYLKVILFFYVWNQTETDTVAEVLSFCHAVVVTMVAAYLPRVVFGAPGKWPPQGAALNGLHATGQKNK